jgi:hypothetical protein
MSMSLLTNPPQPKMSSAPQNITHVNWMKNKNIFTTYSIFLSEPLKLHNHSGHNLHRPLSLSFHIRTAIHKCNMCNTFSNIAIPTTETDIDVDFYPERNRHCRYYNLDFADGICIITD